MKKRILSILLITIGLALGLYAEPINEKTALKVAQNFFISLNLKTNQPLQLNYQKNEAYFVYGNNSSFVIIAADDVSIPILGYSTESSFVSRQIGDTVFVENFFAMLANYEAQINYARENKILANIETKSQWQNLISGVVVDNKSTTTVVEPLLTTTWGQGAFYNAMCPVDANGPNGHVPTGCVATAMGQIMKHNLDTENAYIGCGYYAYTSGSYPETAADFGNTLYNFEIMPNSLSSETAPGAPETAQILYDAAVSCRSIWGTYETGVMFSNEDPMTRAFVNFFGLAYTDIGLFEKMYYTDTEWHGLIQNDLVLGQPVYYRGDGDIGHAWVVDGVDASNLYHMNFGWDGNNNGYYAISSIVPGGTNLTNNQMAITGIKPNDGSTITQDETWGGNITKTTNVAICDAVTVTMNPGATVSFAEGCKLQVFGRLLSEGTSSDWIKFTAIDQNTGWTGVKFENYAQWLMGEVMIDNDSSFFTHTQVEYSKDHGLRVVNFGKVAVDNCKFNNNYKTGVSADGAGIYAVYYPINLTNSHIYNNHATSTGGGVMMTAPNGTAFIVKGNEFYDNIADATGGGFAFYSASGLVFEDNLVYNNQAYKGAGGALDSDDPMIRNNKIVNNFGPSSTHHGALYLNNSSANVVNNLISNNDMAGIVCDEDNDGLFLNNTISFNHYKHASGMIFGENNTNVQIKNCIIYGNETTGSYGSQITIWNDNSDPNFDHCDIEGGLSGFGGPGAGANYGGDYIDNIDEDPLFVNPTVGTGSAYDALIADFSCQANSPCVDAGDLTGIASLLPDVDLAGNPRVVDGLIDMGAYEYFALLSVTANADPTEICIGENSQLEALVSGGTGNYTYAWSTNNSSWTSTSQNPNITPTETTIYTLEVSDGNETVSDDVLVTVDPLPSDASAITGNTDVCRGETGIVYTISTDPNATSYVWTVPNGFTITNGSNTNSITVNISDAANTGIISVYPTNDCGDGGSSSLTVDVHYIVAGAGSNQTINYGQNTTLDGDVTGETSGDIGYSWTPESLLVNPNIEDPTTINLTSTTVFTLTTIDNVYACVNDDNVTITINGGPLAVTANANPNTICEGNASVLEALVSGGTGTYTYSWTANNSSWTSTSQNPNITPTETTIYTLEVSDGNETVSDDVLVTVDPLPSDASAITGNTDVCRGETGVVYTIAVDPNATGYVWTVPNGFTITNGSNTNSITVNISDAANTGTISVYPTNDCGDGGSSSLTVDVHYIVADAGSNQTINYGQNTTLDGEYSGETSGDIGYSWTPESLLVNPNVEDPTTVNLTSTTVFTLTTTDNVYGCVSDDNVTITINGGPLAVTANANPNTICEGNASVLEALVSGGTGTYTYSWTANNSSWTSTSQNPNVTPTETTIYTVEVSDGNETVSDDVLVTVNHVAETPDMPDGPGYVDVSQVISSSYSTNLQANADAYLWQINPSTAGTIIANNEEIIIEWNYYIGYCYLSVKTTNECGESEYSEELEIYLDYLFSVNEAHLSQIKLYPNPGQGIFVIESTQFIQSIIISDLRGQRVKQLRLENNKDLKLKLDLSDLSDGVYILDILINNERHYLKLIKE